MQSEGGIPDPSPSLTNAELALDGSQHVLDKVLIRVARRPSTRRRRAPVAGAHAFRLAAGIATRVRRLVAGVRVVRHGPDIPACAAVQIQIRFFSTAQREVEQPKTTQQGKGRVNAEKLFRRGQRRNGEIVTYAYTSDAEVACSGVSGAVWPNLPWRLRDRQPAGMHALGWG